MGNRLHGDVRALTWRHGLVKSRATSDGVRGGPRFPGPGKFSLARGVSRSQATALPRAISWLLALLLVLVGSMPRAVQLRLGAAPPSWSATHPKQLPVADRADTGSELRGGQPDAGPRLDTPAAATAPPEPPRVVGCATSVLLSVGGDPLLDAFPQWSGPTARSPPAC